MSQSPTVVSPSNAGAVPPAQSVNPCLNTSTGAAMPSLLTTTVPSYTSRTGSLPGGFYPARRPSTLASIVLRKKNEIDILLDGHTVYNTPSYSTHDEIRGSVTLTFDKDTPVDEVLITFEGQACTYVEKLASAAPTSGRTTGRHTFLKLLQPIQSQLLPEDGILRAGETYTLPFLFRVPDRLLPQICSHKVENESIRKHHVQLPPSLGDGTATGDGQVEMDDFAPAMSCISYCIRARAIHQPSPRSRPVEVSHKLTRVRLVPQRDEEPPAELSGNSDYCLRRAKIVKKGFLKFGKLGTLTAETVQPKSLHLPHPSKPITEPITTMTTVRLRFDPMTADEQPPQLGTLVTKLRIHTFFGAAPYRILPEVQHCENWSSLHGVYPQTIELSSRSLSSVTWTRSDDSSSEGSNGLSRRPSTFSALSNATSSLSPIQRKSSVDYFDNETACTGGAPYYYTASIIVPVSLPMAHTQPSSKAPKTFVPSFDCCIVSRRYSLQLSLSYSASGSNKVSTPTITLRSPIQITQEGGTLPEQVAGSDEAIVAEIERQFGLYEQQDQAEGNGGALVDDSSEAHSPVYSYDPPRRNTVANVGAPPEYTAFGSALHRPGEIRLDSPRTYSVSVWG
ncbi:hypothetical protein DV738_g3938, partial [Chaetothyriales sp. CBS 135597]